MNPASKSPLPAVLDPVAIEIIAQMASEMRHEMEQQLANKDQQILRARQALALSEMKIQYLKEQLRLEMIKRYGMRSEKLSDLQLQLLDLESAVSSDEIEAENKREPLPESNASNSTIDKQPRSRRPHPGRNELPSHLERVGKIIACAPEFCTCGKCGGATKVIGYEETEVLDMKPVEFFVTRILREKRACAHCIEQGIATAPAPVRIAPKSIFSDEVIIDILVNKYCDATPIYRQRAILMRDLGIGIALTTLNDAVLRVGDSKCLLRGTATMLACSWLAQPQFGVLPSLPVDRQDDFTCLLVHVGDDIGNQGPHKLLARSHGYAGSIPCRFKIFGKPGEVRCSNAFSVSRLWRPRADRCDFFLPCREDTRTRGYCLHRYAG